MEKFVVIDLETTGHSAAKGDKIIEVGIVVIEKEEITKEFSTFLNPGKEIPSFISNLTGITNQDVVNAPLFADVASEIVSYFQSGYLIAHNVPFDLGFLNQELKAAGMPPLKNPVLDTVEFARIMYPQAPSYKLGELAALLDISHNRPHRAVSDAYVTAEILLRLRKKLNQLPYETIAHLLKLEKVFKSDLSDLLQRRLDDLLFSTDDHYDVYRGIAVKRIKRKEKQVIEEPNLPPFGEYLDDIYEVNGYLEKKMASFEKRQGQREMSEVIFDAFKANRHALIEAGTGTGKSLSYLIPAIYEAVKHRKRIIVSTYTTQLQTQLLEEDIPLIKGILPFGFTAALLKGKNHFINLERLEEALLEEEYNYDIALSKAMIVVWLTETTTGDMDELHLPASGKYFANNISAESEGQSDSSAPWSHMSFYQRVKNEAMQADIIITNHALLCTDMYHGYQFLPSYDYLVIDEAHHLEETASKRYGLKLDYVRMLYELNQIGSVSDDKWLASLLDEHPELADLEAIQNWDQPFDAAKREIDDLFRMVFQFVSNQNKSDKSFSDIGRIQYRLLAEDENNPAWSAIQDMAARLMSFLRRLQDILQDIEKNIDSRKKPNAIQVKNNKESLEKFSVYILELFLQPDENTVRWVEIEAKGAKNAVYMYGEPTDISGLLAKDLFAVKKSVILTSATLTMNGSFSFMIQRLGMKKDEVDTTVIPSVFSFKDQVQLLIPNDFPDIRFGNQADFIAATCEAILSLAEITQGRMLVLFTSYDMLRKAHQLLKETIMEHDFILIAQGITSGSRARLKKNFQSFDKAILFGTNSFWEGVDIPGEDLSSLVIVRLPFEVPDHPLFAARSQALAEAGKNAFFDLSLPNAVIRFKQGFGRLIRSQNDRGIVFVCDARIVKARYGKYFTKSIPDVPITYDDTRTLMEKAHAWF